MLIHFSSWIFLLHDKSWSFTAIGAIFGEAAGYLGGVRASEILHTLLLKNIIHLAQSFFDTNPVGRIISRFSKDIDAIDVKLPMGILDALYCLVDVSKLKRLLIIFKLIKASGNCIVLIWVCSTVMN